MQRRQGAGATLAQNRPLLCHILKLFRKHTDLPLSVKIRLGEKEDVDQLRSFCRMLEEEGIDL
ncbi:MAG: tRNA-dihydrouridine synthase, partial [Desulforhopalus sp.]